MRPVGKSTIVSSRLAGNNLVKHLATDFSESFGCKLITVNRFGINTVMNYTAHYEILIQRAKTRILDEFTESHHIVPRCMGGTDAPNNLVDLTPEEHYTAHLLLTKIYPDNRKLINAAVMMIPNRPSNKLYGWLRRRFAQSQSERQSGNGNSQFGSMWIHNTVLRVSKKIPKTDVIPDGWEKGRVVDFEKYESSKMIKQNKVITKQEKQRQKDLLVIQRQKKKLADDIAKKERKEYILNLYDEFIAGEYYSVSEFHRIAKVTVSRMTLSKCWRKCIPEYKENSKEGKRFRL